MHNNLKDVPFSLHFFREADEKYWLVESHTGLKSLSFFPSLSLKFDWGPKGKWHIKRHFCCATLCGTDVRESPLRFKLSLPSSLHSSNEDTLRWHAEDQNLNISFAKIITAVENKHTSPCFAFYPFSLPTYVYLNIFPIETIYYLLRLYIIYHKTMYYLLRLKLYAWVVSKHCDSMSNRIYTEETV